MSEPSGWYLLSFCDTDRPKGEQFLGCCVVRATSTVEAVTEAHVLGINPGGEVMSVQLTIPILPMTFANRLMSRAEFEPLRQMLGW